MPDYYEQIRNFAKLSKNEILLKLGEETAKHETGQAEATDAKNRSWGIDTLEQIRRAICPNILTQKAIGLSPDIRELVNWIAVIIAAACPQLNPYIIAIAALFIARITVEKFCSGKF